jgi:hypothetical protein
LLALAVRCGSSSLSLVSLLHNKGDEKILNLNLQIPCCQDNVSYWDDTYDLSSTECTKTEVHPTRLFSFLFFLSLSSSPLFPFFPPRGKYKTGPPAQYKSQARHMIYAGGLSNKELE